MNWKRAGVILATIGVTATIGYVSYTYITSAKTNAINLFFEENKDSDFVKNLSDEDKLNAIKKRTNISSKNLVKLSELLKIESLSEKQKKEFDSLISKWNFLKDKKYGK